MSPTLVYLTGFALPVVAAAAAVFLLHRPLRENLIELCGAEHRGVFWTRVCELGVVLGSAAGASLGPLSWMRRAEGDLLAPLLVQLVLGFAAALMTLIVLSLLLLESIGHFELDGPPEGPGEPR